MDEDVKPGLGQWLRSESMVLFTPTNVWCCVVWLLVWNFAVKLLDGHLILYNIVH